MTEQTIRSLALQVAPLAATTTCGAVFEIFDADTDLLMLAVTNGCQPVGLVNRQAFLLRFGERFGRALFERQPVTALMDPAPLIVEADRSVDFLNNLLVTEHEAALLRGFIITEDGRYYGIGTTLSVLRANIAQTRRHAQMVDEIVAALPISLTVQDADGRLLLVNETAANVFSETAERMKGRTVYDFMPEAVAERRRQRQVDLLARRTAQTYEESVSGRTMLTSYKPVTVLEDLLFITTSLDITERKRSEQELSRRAYFDDLTGLPNRAAMQSHVESALKRCTDQDSGFAVAFIDLDNFKHINDYYSHAIGDAVLKAVAERINRQTRKSDVLARISGDEFLLVLEPVTNMDALRASVDRVRDSLRQPFQIEGFEIFTSASIGISLFPDHGRDYETLRRNADNAMYRSKSAAKGTATYYDHQVGEMLAARMELEQKLRLAVRERQFHCAYQPKVNIRSGRVTGFEALARWSVDGKTLGPGKFLPLAMELGMLDEITWHVLEAGLQGLACLDATYGKDTTLSFNIAASQASDPAFMADLAAQIGQSGQAHRLMLELTEDGFLGAARFQDQTLPVLRDLGVRVSIDDFGTGYSSLSVLADLTADEIKVDRSFISAIEQRPRNQSVLKTIESLSHALGLQVVAEGVETEAELAYLLANTSIDLSQGYFFAQPMSAKALAEAGLPGGASRRPRRVVAG